MSAAGKTTAELLEMQESIHADPLNWMPRGSLFKYTKSARKKLDAITREITHNLAVARAARGDPVPTCGYLGRQSNRR